MLVILHIKN